MTYFYDEFNENVQLFFLHSSIDDIFNQNPLLFWSPKTQYLAYIKLNLQYLPKNHYLNYEETADNRDQYSIPYPKYGDTLPSIDLYIYSIKSGRNLLVPKPADLDNL